VSSDLDSSSALPDDPGKRAHLLAPEGDDLRASASELVDEGPVAAAKGNEDSTVPGEIAADVSGAEAAGAHLDDDTGADDADADDEYVGDAEPLELIEAAPEGEEIRTDWYILKVQVNRESTICEALERRVKVAGLERYFGKIIVPTEEVQEFTKTGKKRVVKRKLYPGYIMVNMAINDDTWFLVRETPGIGDFTGSAGKPTPMKDYEIAAILKKTEPDMEDVLAPKIGIKVKPGDRVRVKEGYFQNFEGDVESIDEANGRITVIINIFNRSTPVELEHWQVEEV
jgi:transcriptional antiterminator NusG